MSSAGNLLWQPSSSASPLGSGDLHLWRFPLASSPADLLSLPALLSSDEVQRSARLLDPRRAQAFSVGRARLRQILSFYLVIAPAQIVFTYGCHGKPVLQRPAPADLTFNLSHSGAWALLALGRGREVGVDLEKIDPLLDYQRLAVRFLTCEENALLAAVPAARRRRLFYRLWTAKEARLKGEGGGFSTPRGSGPQGWTTRSFWVGRGYVGAVAWAGEGSFLRRFSLAE